MTVVVEMFELDEAEATSAAVEGEAVAEEEDVGVTVRTMFDPETRAGAVATELSAVAVESTSRELPPTLEVTVTPPPLRPGMEAVSSWRRWWWGEMCMVKKRRQDGEGVR